MENQIETNWENETNLSPVLKRLLVQRGITEEEQMKEFLSPQIKRLHDPGNFSTIQKAKKRIDEAIQANEKILVFGDYDADGVSSTALLISALQELGANCDYYIPNRFTEGYGPNETAFRKAKDNGVRVIITVDNGVAALHEAKVAKELGIDLIITDHHEAQGELPDAYALIHPKCSPDYPFDELAGVGVAFKLAQYLLGYFPEHLLDFVAIGTIADLVPLVDENRILAFYGLKQLSTTTKKGLVALKKQCHIDGEVTEEDVGFRIGPRINAVGRLQNATMAVRLLLSKNVEEAEQLATTIQEINERRQQIVSDIVEEAEQLVDPNDTHSAIVVAKQGWNEGVLGIVASRLVKTYDRPAIVLSINEDKTIAKGSARSIPTFDLFQQCMKLKHLFTNFGGHSQAAGMTLPIENVDVFRSELNQLIQSELTEADFKQIIQVNGTLEITEIDEVLITEINKMAPFGMGNPKPIFRIHAIPDNARQIGHLKNHLKLAFNEENASVEAIGFQMGNLYPYVTPNTAVSIVGELGINEWNGFKKPQMVMQDMQIETRQVFDYRGKSEIDISFFMEQNQHNVVLLNEENNTKYSIPKDATILHYTSSLEFMEQVDALYIYDLPPQLTKLKDIVEWMEPKNIYACFQVENSAYMTAIPSREDFKWLYMLLLKRKEINLKNELSQIIRMKQWSKEKVLWMSKVFFELEFVKIDGGVIQINPSPKKQDLQSSKTYQQQIERAKIEKMLYYSTYDQLKKWFAKCLPGMDMSKEEASYGL